MAPKHPRGALGPAEGRPEMKPVVDQDLCIGCALCSDLCPEVFEIGDDGYAHVIDEAPDPELYGSVRDAESSCPTSAISIAEE